MANGHKDNALSFFCICHCEVEEICQDVRFRVWRYKLKCALKSSMLFFLSLGRAFDASESQYDVMLNQIVVANKARY